MRKFFALLLVLALCLSMAACGKSEAVKAVEAMIDALGTVTEDSGAAIYAIDDAYAALAEEEQGKVKNYKNFLKAKEAYYEMTLAGIWYPCDLNPADLEHNFSPRFYIELNADMTMISKSDFRGTSAGIWDVSEGNDLFLKVDYMETETSSSVPGNDDGFHYTITYVDGTLRLEDNFITYVKAEDYLDLLDDIVLAVDCSTEDLSNYFGFTSEVMESIDEWGAPTGDIRDRVRLTNKLFDEGWVFMGTTQDFAFEVTWPEYSQTYLYPDGSSQSNTIDAGSHTVYGSPYYFGSLCLDLSWISPDFKQETTLTLEDLSFGRGKGTMYFIHKDMIADIRYNQEHGRELVFDVQGNHLFVIPETFFQVSPYTNETHIDF